MNRRQIFLKLALNHLEIKQTLDSFDGRLILQKAVYLLQEAGVDLGYHYSWYLRGPYSPSLTSDAYSTFSTETPKDWEIGQNIQQQIDRIKPLVREKLAAQNSARLFENLASILFILRTGQATKTQYEIIEEKMTKAGKSIDRVNVQQAIGELEDYGFI